MFGTDDKSWMLDLYTDAYVFYQGSNRYNRNHDQFHHNKVQTPVSGPRSSRVGVYLDHSAGVLSFYSVSDTMTLLTESRPHSLNRSMLDFMLVLEVLLSSVDSDRRTSLTGQWVQFCVVLNCCVSIIVADC